MHNYPHQLDRNINLKEVKKITTLKEIRIRAGDLIVAGSDGYFDNLFIKDTLSYINEHFLDQKKSLKEITDELGQMAYKNSLNRKAKTPFSESMIKNVKRGEGV